MVRPTPRPAARPVVRGVPGTEMTAAKPVRVAVPSPESLGVGARPVSLAVPTPEALGLAAGR